MKKCFFIKTLSLILALSTIFSLFIFSPAVSAETSGNWWYAVSYGEATITSYDGSESNVTIPSEIDGYPVTGLDSVFYRCTFLTSVTIPDTVTKMGNGTFYECTGLTNVTIPDSVTSIGTQTFHGCTSLTSVTIPGTVTSIGNWAFENCTSLTSVKIGNGVTSIGIETFRGCTSLTSVTIPDTVTTIGNRAFYDCNSLASVTIPDSVMSIGGDPFYNTALINNDVNYENGVLYVDNYLVKAKESIFGSYAIKEGTLCISGSAFKDCALLTNVTIPDSVMSIGDDAFTGCDGLTSVTIPDSVKNIGGSAFSGCTGFTSVTIPDSVTSIGGSAFSGCTGLTSVTIPDSVTNIGILAFNYCISLKSLTIPDSVTRIGYAAFCYCFSLTSVTIPDSVTSIDDAVFCDCTSLTSVIIPDSVTSIGTKSFGWYYSRKTGRYEKVENFIIYGHEGTAAQDYAKENGFEFKDPGEYQLSVNFRDVKADAYYADAVAWAVAKGITTGTSATTFSPEDGCTRGQVVTFLWRAAGSPEPTGAKNPFKDVKSGEYYYKAVLWAVENEITSGTSATTFSPNDVCTRGQIVTFLWRANGKPTPAKTKNPFKDVTSGDYFNTAVLWAVDKGITLGTDATHFSPSDTCTRGQVVTFLFRGMA